MSIAIEYLENLQGLILYAQTKHNGVTNLGTWLRLPEDVLHERINEFKADYRNVLNDDVYEKRRGNHVLIRFHELFKYIDPEFEGFVNPREVALAYFRGEVEAIEKEERLYSKFEPISYLGLTITLHSALVRSIYDLQLEWKDSFVIGTAATQGINACALRLENGEGIIVLERDLMSLLHLATKGVILSFAKRFREDGGVSFDIDLDELKKVDRDNIAVVRFRDVICSYVKGSPLDAEAYELSDPGQLELANLILYGAELFVTGHEFGHLIKEHRRGKRKIYTMNPITGIQGETWEKEYEADNIGVRILLENIGSFISSPGFQYIGAELFFFVYEIAGRAANIYKNGRDDLDNNFESHPPYEKRIEKLREYIASHYGKDAQEEALFFANIIRRTLEILWEKVREDVYKLSENHKN